jgi:hypothetical protein
LFSSALTLGKTAWISTGGDPYNDFWTIYHGIRLSTARTTGPFKTNLTRGARIFEIEATSLTSVQMTSYSIDEKGDHSSGFDIRYPP